MSDEFRYRPKFVDIRIRPPPKEDASPRDGARTCEHPGCARPASCRAPKSRTDPDLWWFCEEHAALYNANWNFFADMSAAEEQAFFASAFYGHRPTWSWRSGGTGRTTRQRATQWNDGHGVFASGPRGARRGAPDPRPRVSRVQAQALAALDLDETADQAAIRIRYAELVKRYHPDANGGDRSSEHRLQAVMRAYQVLRRSRMA